MESVHTDTKNAAYDPSRRGEPRVLAIRLIRDNSIESAETETGAKLAMRSNAACEMRVVTVVPLSRSLNYGIEPHRSLTAPGASQI